MSYLMLDLPKLLQKKGKQSTGLANLSMVMVTQNSPPGGCSVGIAQNDFFAITFDE